MRKNHVVGLFLTTIIVFSSAMTAFAESETVRIPMYVTIPPSKIDFSVTEKINMTGYLGTTELVVDELSITNNNSVGSIKVDADVSGVNGWTVVNKDMEFEKLPNDAKQISITADIDKDMSQGTYADAETIRAGETGAIFFEGETGAVSSNVEEQAAKIVATISPVSTNSTQDITITAKNRSMLGDLDKNELTVPEFFEFEGKKYRVTGIDSGAFADCGEIKTIVLPMSISYIGEGAFSSESATDLVVCTQNEVVKAYDWIGNNITVIYPTKCNISGTTLAEYYGYTTETMDLVIPAAVEVSGTWYMPVQINAHIFENNTNLKSITLPDTITDVGIYSFSGCTNLESVEWGDSITGIASRTFNECSALKNVTIPANTDEIGSAAFKGCGSLESIIIPEKVEIVYGSSFDKCVNLKEVTFLGDDTVINSNVFSNCESLSKVVLPKNLKSIEASTFKYCYALEEITIPAMVEKVDTDAFKYCKNLKTVIFTGKCETIGESAFESCPALKYVRLPDDLKSIGQSAFYGAESLVAMRLPDTVTEIGTRAFRSCSSLMSINIPEGVMTIGPSTFKECSSLKTIYIPDSMTLIDDEAFMYCSDLYDISLPQGVELGTDVFAECASEPIYR